MKQFQYVAVAGTFDRLHKGHEALLLKAFAVSERVAVGVTVEDLTKGKKLYNLILPYETRVNEVKDFLAHHDLLDRAVFFPLHDVYGPAITDETLQALVVSTKTLSGGKHVNKKRKHRNMPPLTLVVCDYISSDDDSYLSSTRLRYGEITRDGHVYGQFLKQHAPFIISQVVKAHLKKPLGELLKGTEHNKTKAVKNVHRDTRNLFVTVGDIVTRSFQDQGVVPDLAVIDHQSKRTLPVATEESGVVRRVRNDAGTITKDAISELDTIVKKIRQMRESYTLVVDGEEDLLVLPLILLLPLASTIFYGQPNEGIVRVTVAEENKKQIERLLQPSTVHP